MRFTTTHLDDIDRLDNGDLIWRPVHRTLGVTAFGVNGYTGVAAGDAGVRVLVRSAARVRRRRL